MYENLPMVVNTNGVMTERFYTFCFSPIRLEDGSVGGILDTVSDNTDEVALKQELKQSETEFRTYLEDSPYAFMYIDRDWTIRYLNPMAKQLTHKKEPDIIGQNLWSVFPGLLVYPLQDGIAVTFRDFTTEKKLELDLSSAVKSRDEFLSVASHELKTPLTAMKLQAQIIQRDIEKDNPRVFQKEKITRFYEQIFKQVNRLNRLVDDMLDVSRIQLGKLGFRKEPTDLDVLLKEVMERMDSYFKNSESGVPAVEYKGSDFKGNWDAFRIEQVMNNLFTNAIRYGNGKPFLVTLEGRPESVVFSVTDHGYGVSPKDQQVIFEQYERGSEHGPIEGLGLGLYITKKIVEGHGGVINLESVEGKGSTFTVVLPK